MLYKMIDLLNLSNVIMNKHALIKTDILKDLHTSEWLDYQTNKKLFLIYAKESKTILASLELSSVLNEFSPLDDYESVDYDRLCRYITTILACTKNEYEVEVISSISKLLNMCINTLHFKPTFIILNSFDSSAKLNIKLENNGQLLNISLNIGADSLINNTRLINEYGIIDTTNIFSHSKNTTETTLAKLVGNKLVNVATLTKSNAGVTDFANATNFNKDSLIGIKSIIDNNTVITIELISEIIDVVQSKETEKLKLSQILCSSHYNNVHRDVIIIVLCSSINTWTISVHV